MDKPEHCDISPGMNWREVELLKISPALVSGWGGIILFKLGNSSPGVLGNRGR